MHTTDTQIDLGKDRFLWSNQINYLPNYKRLESGQEVIRICDSIFWIAR